MQGSKNAARVVRGSCAGYLAALTKSGLALLLKGMCFIVMSASCIVINLRIFWCQWLAFLNRSGTSS